MDLATLALICRIVFLIGAGVIFLESPRLLSKITGAAGILLGVIILIQQI